MLLIVNTSESTILDTASQSQFGERIYRGFGANPGDWQAWTIDLNRVEGFKGLSGDKTYITTSDIEEVELVSNTALSNTYNDLKRTKYSQDELIYVSGTLTGNTTSRDARIKSTVIFGIKNLVPAEIRKTYSINDEFKFSNEQYDLSANSSLTASSDLTEYRGFVANTTTKYQALKTTVNGTASANLHTLNARALWDEYVVPTPEPAANTSANTANTTNP